MTPRIITREQREARIQMRGAGDVVAAITRAVGIKPCGGCKRRQQKLNQLFPFTVDSTNTQH